MHVHLDREVGAATGEHRPLRATKDNESAFNRRHRYHHHHYGVVHATQHKEDKNVLTPFTTADVASNHSASSICAADHLFSLAGSVSERIPAHVNEETLSDVEWRSIVRGWLRQIEALSETTEPTVTLDHLWHAATGLTTTSAAVAKVPACQRGARLLRFVHRVVDNAKADGRLSACEMKVRGESIRVHEWHGRDIRVLTVHVDVLSTPPNDAWQAIAGWATYARLVFDSSRSTDRVSKQLVGRRWNIQHGERNG